jgi:hypothetical protein
MDIIESFFQEAVSIGEEGRSVLGLFFSLYFGTITVGIAIITFIPAYASYRMKSSTKITARYVWSSDLLYQDTYVNSITLENHKDKSEAIFGIYLRLGRNVYIELEEFSERPLILPPFEAVTRTLSPVSHYSYGSTIIDINEAFRKKHLKRSIILSTSRGKYKTKSSKGRWHPRSESLRNDNIAALYCTRVENVNTKGNKYVLPTNALYIMYFTQDGKDKQSSIFGGEFSHQNDKNFAITEESLQCKEVLLKHLRGLESLKELRVDPNSIRVVNVDEIPEVERDRNFFKDTITATPNNSKLMNVVGRASAIIRQLVMDRSNHDRHAKGMTYLEKRVIVVYGALATVILFITVGYYFWG